MVKQTHGFSKKQNKTKQNPIYVSVNSSSKAKTEIKNKPNLKKTNSLVINENDQRTTAPPQTRATLQQPTEHNSSSRVHWASKIGPIGSEIGHASLGLDSFLASTCCPTVSNLRPPCSLKVFHLYTSLSFSLLHLWVNGFETLSFSEDRNNEIRVETLSFSLKFEVWVNWLSFTL